MKKKYNKVEDFYGSLSNYYGDMYHQEKLLTSEVYMADWFRYTLIIRRLKELKIKGNILDIGCGEATPLMEICRSTGLSPYALDITNEMVSLAKKKFRENKYNQDNVIKADISKKKFLKNNFAVKKFNASLCLGVMPHVTDIVLALRNIRKKMSSGSVSFISFRNLLFSLFTLNKYSKDFFIEKLLIHLNKKEKEKIEKELSKRFNINYPPMRKINKAGGVGYDTIPANFHNPLTIKNITKKAGFDNAEIYFYHYHATPPMYESKCIDNKSFRKKSLKLEQDPTDWRGYFMCSAFLLELKVL